MSTDRTPRDPRDPRPAATPAGPVPDLLGEFLARCARTEKGGPA